MYELIYLFWVILGNFGMIEDKKLNDNLIKIIHSIFTSFFGYLTLINDDNEILKQVFYNFSKTYFIWDTGNILINRGFDFPYLMHHLCILYILQQVMFYDKYYEIIINGYIIGELSNISIYTTYHLIKKDYDNIMIKFIQIIWYGYFRVYLLTNHLIEYQHLIDSQFLYFNLWLIYLMGVSWWGVQNYQFCKKNKIIDKINNIKIKYKIDNVD
tara:strand:+ start:357 stop:995 length:639 start_codon:yes stop_codon:yes gene_type:complete